VTAVFSYNCKHCVPHRYIIHVVVVMLQIGRHFFHALSLECQHCVVSALVDVAVATADLQSATATAAAAAAVSCLKQVLKMHSSFNLKCSSYCSATVNVSVLRCFTYRRRTLASPNTARYDTGLMAGVCHCVMFDPVRINVLIYLPVSVTRQTIRK